MASAAEMTGGLALFTSSKDKIVLTIKNNEIMMGKKYLGDVFTSIVKFMKEARIKKITGIVESGKLIIQSKTEMDGKILCDLEIRTKGKYESFELRDQNEELEDEILNEFAD